MRRCGTALRMLSLEDVKDGQLGQTRNGQSRIADGDARWRRCVLRSPVERQRLRICARLDFRARCEYSKLYSSSRAKQILTRSAHSAPALPRPATTFDSRLGHFRVVRRPSDVLGVGSGPPSVGPRSWKISMLPLRGCIPSGVHSLVARQLRRRPLSSVGS